MKKFLQYVAMAILILGTILPSFGMEVKAEENTEANCTINYSSNIKILNEQQTADSMMNSYVQKEATVQQKDGQYTVDITVPKAYTTWYQGFKVESGGGLKEAIGKTKDINGNDIYTFVVDQYEQTIKAWVDVNIPELSYVHNYIIYLEISNVEETNRVCEEVPEQPEQPKQPEENTDEVITKNVPFTFLTNNKTFDTYFKSYINYADLATVGEEKYAYIKLTGHTYAFTTLKEGNENGEDVKIVSSEGEGNSLVRVIKVKLDANLKATVIMSGEKYPATLFTFDFTPVKETGVYLPKHFNTNNQVIEFGLTPVNSGAPAHTIISSLLGQAYAIKTADNKIAVTMNLVVNDTTKSFSVKQGNKTVAEWTVGSTRNVIKFTVDSLENLAFTLTTERNGTASTMSTTVEKVLLTGEIAKQEESNSEGNTNGSESGSGENNNNSNTDGNNNSNTENTEQSTNGLYTVNFTFLNESGTGSSIMNTYVNSQAYVVKNGSSYQVQLTLKNSSWITGFTVNGATPSTISDTNDVRVVQFTVSSLAALQNAWVKVDIGDLNYHHDYNILLKFDEASLSKINGSTTFPNTGGSTDSGSTQSTNGLYTVNFTFLNESGTGSSIMNTYVNSQAYVVKNGSSYQVQLTLKNSSWITGFIVNGATPSTISDTNDVRVVQFTVSSLAALQNAWVKVDIGDLNYHHDYNILLKFDEASLSKINGSTTFPNTGGSTSGGSTNNGTNIDGTTGNFSQEGIVRFEFAKNAKEITVFLQKAKTVFEDNKYKVTLSLNIENNLQNFIVKQNGKEIAKWSNKVASLVPIAIAKTATLSFETDTLDNLVFEAATTDKAISTNVTATTTKTNEKNTRQSITYKMKADPNGNMADFITNYLAPYFTKAELVTIDGKRYIEMTLIGKAYGFETLAYIDGNGKQQNIEVISSTGETMDQVRVVRLPLVRDSNGVTKIFVDSGSLGYGAYTLFFTFDVPALEEETNNSINSNNSTDNIKNPFTDIDNVFSKDEILALYAAGITTGTTATTFSPNKNITRAQFAVMIARALNIQSAKETAFTDVKGKWYENEVQALAEVGIVTGVNSTTFNPTANITRQQAAAMILRMLEYKGYKVTVDKNAFSYKDASKVFDYAKQAVSELQAQDIMTGSNGYLNPQNNLTRAQMAKILKRSLELVNLID
ncbi:NEAT domain-containing protein [Lysinibacillus sp. NPDC092081]|uniref:NEAT domain-containing protein n=1 Tax=Lysinibacillus sp. NPDC092081 TaxID=3364131 RepID=UPI0037FEC4B2